jgi:BCCT, betaine/carnitine/choline family transporter
MLTAHVTRGRKLREVIALGLLFPIMYTLAWFCTWSGIGFRQDRQALELQMLGTEHFNNSAHFMTDGSSMCYDVPQESVIVDNTTIFTNFLPDVTPVCQLDYSAEGFHSNVLNILSSFRFAGSTDHGPGVALVLLFALTCAVNLIASADSTSLMVDSLASSARKNYHWLRRLFWAGTVGALAISLLSLGGDIFQSAIESFLVVSTFPMLIIMCFVLHPILLLCRAADEDPDGGRHESEYRVSTQAEFDMPIYGGIFNMVEYIVSMGKVNVARVELGMHQPTTFQITEFAKGLVLPFVSLHQVLSSTYPQSPKTNAILVAGYTFCFVAWFATWITSSQWYPGLGGLNWAFLVAMGVILGMVRSSFRAKYSLQSNVFADFVGSLFLWPQVLTQMRLHCEVQGGNAKRSCNVDSSEDRIEC